MCDWFFPRDKTRDELCARLQDLGMSARLADRVPVNRIADLRPEERSGPGSLGIIVIADGPIPWVNVRKRTISQADESSTYYYTDYGVNVPYATPNTTIESVRRRDTPRGKAIDAEWKAEGPDQDSALVADVLRRLGEDAQVTEAIIATGDVAVDTRFPGLGRGWDGTGTGSAWVITPYTEEVPTRQEWDCYQAIARHLIEAGREQPNTE